jgi:hypothetical protein
VGGPPGGAAGAVGGLAGLAQGDAQPRPEQEAGHYAAHGYGEAKTESPDIVQRRGQVFFKCL